MNSGVNTQGTANLEYDYFFENAGFLLKRLNRLNIIRGLTSRRFCSSIYRNTSNKMLAIIKFIKETLSTDSLSLNYLYEHIGELDAERAKIVNKLVIYSHSLEMMQNLNNALDNLDETRQSINVSMLFVSEQRKKFKKYRRHALKILKKYRKRNPGKLENLMSLSEEEKENLLEADFELKTMYIISHFYERSKNKNLCKQRLQ